MATGFADSGRRLMRALGLVALVVAGGAAATPAVAAPGPEYFGTNLQTIGLLPRSGWDAALGQLAAGQMNIDRFQVNWGAVEPSAPSGDWADPASHAYSWGSTDDLITLMARRGLRAAPLFRFAPGWAQKYTAPADELPPASYDSFGLMMAAFAKRYGPGGSFWALHPELSARPTLSYELWNEANLDDYAWNRHADAGIYSDVLKAVRPRLKAAQPHGQLVGSLAWQQSGPGVATDFVAKLAAAGGLAQLDAIGFHPYGPDAQTIINLVTTLRSQLSLAGYGSLPIYANETGQPVAYSGPGATHGYEGFPSDAARASSVAFAGEALAASDCGVEQFLLYTIVGSESALEPIGEGYMGMLRVADGSPNVTGQALQRASQRWAGRFAPGGPGAPALLHLCNPGPSPDASLLPIAATFVSGASGCVTVHASYDGNPLESAMLRFQNPANGTEVASARTDAFGNTGQCIPENLRGQPFTAVADVAGAGRSAVLQCDVPGVGCPPGATYSGSSGTLSALAAGGKPVVTAPAKPKCAWKLVAVAGRPTTKAHSTRSRIGLRASLSCAAVVVPAPTAIRFAVTLKRKGKKHQTRVTSFLLAPGKVRRLTLTTTLKRGDQLVVRHPGNVKSGVPEIQRQLKLRTSVRR